ncbi:MAG: VWA domain-containing protein [Phycisphaerales bacterium]|nr:VWA domain-containing protein [Phycisphaerales bacterium]
MTPVHPPFTPEWLYFAWPWAFAALLLLPAMWAWWAWRTRAAIRYSTLNELREVAPQRWNPRLLLGVLRSAALACLIVAVARPVLPDESTRVFAEGIAIQAVIDTSTSMQDYDLSPPGLRMTRLDVAKEVFRQFVSGDGDNLPGRSTDLIGLIRFAGYADSVCPLTLDYHHLETALTGVRTVMRGQEDGTAIGDALALAVERLRDLKRITGSGEQLQIKSRVIILLTDGENNQGLITPRQAGDLAALSGIRVYSIMAGTGQLISPISRRPADDRDLSYIAEVTGGKHYRARDAASLFDVYREIDQLERTRVEEKQYVQWSDMGFPWLLAAFSLVGVQTLLDATWLRKIP